MKYIYGGYRYVHFGDGVLPANTSEEIRRAAEVLALAGIDEAEICTGPPTSPEATGDWVIAEKK